MFIAAKQIYREIHHLFPDLHSVQPYQKLDLRAQGFGDVELTVLESTPDTVDFIITRYESEHGHLLANPSIEILVNQKTKTANVVTYKDLNYFHEAVPEAGEIGTIALSQANHFLYEFLNELKNCKRASGNKNFQSGPISHRGR